MSHEPEIVILAPLPFELAGFLRSRFYQKNAHRIRPIVGGMGAQAFRETLRHLSCRPQTLLLAGVAGGLHPGATTGSIFRSVVNVRAPFPATLPGRLFAHQGDRLTPWEGELLSMEHVVETAWEKRKIRHAHPRALVVDMETLFVLPILQEAVGKNRLPGEVKISVLRVVSDGPEDDFPVPSHLMWDAKKARTPWRDLLRYLLTHPAKGCAFLDFSRRACRAQAVLTAQLIVACRHSLPW